MRKVRSAAGSAVLALVVVAVGGLLLVGCGSSSKKASNPTTTGAAAAAKTAGGSAANAVTIQGFAFAPKTLNAKVGWTVTWTNKDSTDHTVSSDSSDPAKFDSGHLGNGKTFSFTFAKPGTYKYFCKIHSFMKATVVVS